MYVHDEDQGCVRTCSNGVSIYTVSDKFGLIDPQSPEGNLKKENKTRIKSKSIADIPEMSQRANASSSQRRQNMTVLLIKKYLLLIFNIILIILLVIYK